MGDFAVNDGDEINIDQLKEVDSSTFFNALNHAKIKNSFSVFVSLHPEDHYDECVGKYLLYDNTAGVAVEKDGNIISVFSDRTHKGVLKYLIAKAIQAGGIKLDCFGSDGLKALYHRRGFIPVSRTKFVREFAPPDWNYGRDEEPDIIFWVYNIDRASPMEDDVSKEDWENIKEFPDYETAMKYRDELLSKVLKEYYGV